MRESKDIKQMRTAVALLRITLGVILLATWYDNIRGGLYTAEGLTGFFNWLFDSENGNGSSFLFYRSFLNTFVVPIAGPFGAFQLAAEFILGLALLLGFFTRFFGIAAMLFFSNLFLSYFGGHEWIWTYVILFMSAVTITLGSAGRRWGIDSRLLESRGEPRVPILW